MDIYDLDEATTALILDLQLEDAAEFSNASKGKGKEDEMSDSDLAITLYRSELERLSSIVHDHRMTRSIATACQTDSNALEEATRVEQLSLQDHQEARRLGGIATPAAPLAITSGAEDDDLIDKLEAIYVGHSTYLRRGSTSKSEADGAQSLFDGCSSHAESSSWAETRTYHQKDRQCVICRDTFKFFDTARAPCNHDYCRECLQELFKASFTDESLFPPRCCGQKFAINNVRILLNPGLIDGYESKKIEFGTVNRIYCSDPTCSAFIGGESTVADDSVSCSVCHKLTCVICKAPAHEGDCPADEATQQLLRDAAEAGWKRCQKCKHLVELDTGCYHITCRCGFEFCYLCSRPWKTCPCQHWDEDMLEERGAHIVDRQPHFGGHHQRQARIAAVVEDLRLGHECEHVRWTYVSGSHRCEECGHRLPEYIFECRQCRLQACNRCRRNRL